MLAGLMGRGCIWWGWLITTQANPWVRSLLRTRAASSRCSRRFWTESTWLGWAGGHCRCLRTRVAHAHYLSRHGADYVFVVKANQPKLAARLAGLPWAQIPSATSRARGAMGGWSAALCS